VLIVVEAIDWIVLVAGKKATVFARRQSQSKDPLLHCPPGAAVPQQVEIILANYGRSKDMGIIKLPRLTWRKNGAIGVALPRLRL